MKKFKSIISILLIGVLLLSVVGCSNENTAPETDTNVSETNKTTTTNDKKEITSLTLTIHASWVNSGMEALVEYVNSKSEETGAKIVLDKLPEGDMGDQVLKTRFAAGEYPDIVAFFNASESHDDLGGVDNFADISGDWTKNYSADMLNSSHFTVNEKLIAVPFGSINIGGMLYNKSVFDELGLEIPTTWNEFLSVCEVIKEAGRIPAYYSGKDAWTMQIIPILGFGRELVGKDVNKVYSDINTNNSKFADQALFIDSLNKMKELKDKGFINDTYLSDTYDNAQKVLVDGDAAMYCMASWVMPGMVESYGKEATEQLGAFAVPFDNNASVSAWMPWCLLVPENGNNKELAKTVVQLMASKEAQQAFFDEEPSIPFIRGLEVDLLPAVQDLYDIFSEPGRGVPEFTGKVKYGQGPDFETNCQSLVIGEMTAEEVASMIDQHREKSAKAKGDENWK